VRLGAPARKVKDTLTLAVVPARGVEGDTDTDTLGITGRAEVRAQP